ncbi:MAG: hypothetical protein CL663_03360 [Bacteroidetes bacterium]|nr:hypothetical protein [Bacteroidota bacterium]|tara:strand:+ start:482 stop:682 length:201 start_codon:yes stop_codon:yes gene_type:complete
MEKRAKLISIISLLVLLASVIMIITDGIGKFSRIEKVETTDGSTEEIPQTLNDSVRLWDNSEFVED